MAKVKDTSKLDLAKFPATPSGARALKIPYYYTGKACPLGHVGLRYTTSGNCIICATDTAARKRGTFRADRSEANVVRAHAALDAAATTYRPDKPCKHGHYERYVGTNNCVACNAATMRKRNDEGYSRWRRIAKVYGLSRDAYTRLVTMQNGCCAICGEPLPEEGRCHIDHNHDTGKIRGILCGTCNQGIGLLRESADLMRKAVAYLEAHAK